MTTSTRVAILLSTYNGEKFLPEQLDSLLRQTHDNFILVARDDGSSDETRNILQNYQSRYSHKIHLVESDIANLGARDSFAYLIGYVLRCKQKLELEYAYMLFCDQDDVWFPNKVETQVNAMLKCEADNPQAPVLVHSDLEVVSESLKVVAPSLAAYQGLETQRNSFNQMVISNLVTGCTAMLNETLASKCLPVSKNAIMHDWWLALVASAFGKVVYLDQALIHYRQHGSNTIGAKEHEQAVATQPRFWSRLFSLQANEHLIEVAVQAKEFADQFGTDLSEHQHAGLKLAGKMETTTGIFQRIYYRRARRY